MNIKIRLINIMISYCILKRRDIYNIINALATVKNLLKTTIYNKQMVALTQVFASYRLF